MFTHTLMSVGTVLSAIAAVATFIYGLVQRFAATTKASLEVVIGGLWIVGAAAILLASVREHGIESLDLFLDVLILCGFTLLIIGLLHRHQLAKREAALNKGPGQPPEDQDIAQH